MQAATSRISDLVPANYLIFTENQDPARIVTSMSPSASRGRKVPLMLLGKARSPKIVEDPVAQSRLAELFALRREEKPPENFIQDALAQLHRRQADSKPDGRV